MERDEESIVVGTRMVLVNKGTVEAPRVKARLVAQEFKTSEMKDELFAGTPGLGAIRFILSETASNRTEATRLMLMDVTGAFLYGYMRRRVYIELPPEEPKGKNVVGRLVKALYGLRDAPLIWKAHLTQSLKKAGIEECDVMPGIFRHRSRGILVAVHVKN